MSSEPLNEASREQLSVAVEENLFELFRAMSFLPGYEAVERGALSYHHAFPTNPMFKGVWRTRLAAEETEAALDETLAWFAARRAPYWFWWFGPRSEPADLADRLVARGFQMSMHGDPGMAVDLREINEEVRTPPGFAIVEVEDRRMLDDWRDAFVSAYEIPLFAGQAWVDATLAAGIDAAPWRLYVGYWNGKPVVSNILFNGAGVASVYGVGTVAEARGRGIGAAVTLQPLLDARRQGYRYGALLSTEMGYPVYRRLGFYEVGCTVGRCMLWRG